MSKLSRLLRQAVTAVVAVFVVMVASPPIAAQAHPGHGHVLIFTATTQFRHTDAINQGTPVLTAALEAEGIAVTHTEDPTVFTDEGLAEFDAIMMFQTSGDPWNADQKAALQRFVQAGGGISAVHNATDMRGNWDWWDGLVGTTMPGHAPTGTDPGLQGTVRVEDHHHPSTDHLDQRWTRSDEWYNYDVNVRGDAHVLATMDESTYTPGSNAMGYDHPISWCRTYDGARTWVTGMGHFGSHYTNEPDFVQHIVKGTMYAAGLLEGDCGGTVWNSYEKVALDENTSAPFAMDVAPDGKVFYTELVRGQIRVYDPATQATTTAITIPVYSGGEDGLLGITLANDFADTGHLYVYYAPASSDDTDPANFYSQLSRFTYENGSIDPASEKVLLEVPARRLPDEPGHTGGGLDMDADGNLYLGVGDDVNPHSEPSGGYAPLSTRSGTFHDARETSANTNDLRGKLLRIHPEPDGTYTIPEGNLFDEAQDTDDKTLPEIYAMGFRNPFRFSIDPKTGWIGLADYSPDNNTDNLANRGPAGIAEYNVIKSPGNYGWPLCMGANEPFRDVDYGETSAGPVVVGDFFDCDNPVNDSPRNTGLTDLPSARGADMYYGYQRTSAPGVINAGGGLAPMGGPFYDYDADLDSDTKFPAYFDGKPFYYDWARNKMYSVSLSETATDPGDGVEKVNPFLPQEQFLAPIDSKFGPDGSLYVLDWGGGYGRDNPNSGLHRVDYITGSRSPIAQIDADQTSGPAPLTVSFDGTGSTDPEAQELTYAWDFDDDGTVDSTEPTATYTYETEGAFSARLTVTDPDGKDGTTTEPITVGNTEPTVEFNLPPSGSFFEFGEDLSWDVTVTDPEDGEVDGADVVIQPALGHDEHAHPTQPLSGLTGTTETSLGGHAEDEDIFFAIDGRYTDQGGADGANPLTGSATTLVFPKLKQAEFFKAKAPTLDVGPSRDVAGGGQVLVGQNGDWAQYTPVNLHQIDQIALRVSAATAGTIELRRGAPDGELLATADVPATGARNFRDVVVDVTDPGMSFDLYVVFPGEGARRLNFIEAIGKGSSPETRPRVAITAPEEGVVLEPGTAIEVAAEATDAENTVTEVEFFADGESIGTDSDAPYTTMWEPDGEKVYKLTAVATNDLGLTSTSRVVGAQVGELFGSLLEFSNAGGEFEKVDDGVFAITGAGNNAWQSVDQYSTLYEPGGADDDTWEAVVRVNSQTHAHGSAKSGLIVRNDATQPGQSPGYALLGIRPNNGVEFLRDTDGNGQLDASTAGGSTTYPIWLKLKRDGAELSAFYSVNGTTWNQVGDPATLTGTTSPQDVGMVTVAHSATAGTAQFQGFAIDSDPQTEEPEEPLEPLRCPGPLSDEFDGDEIASKWSVRQAPEMPVTVADGALQLPVTAGDINEATPGPISFVGQPAPDGEWEASAKITLDHTTHWQWAGLLVHASDDEYNKLAFVRHENGNRFLEFQTETGGSRTNHGAFTVPAEFPSTVHLKLVSDGTSLTAHYSTDGESWTQMAGTAPLKADAELGLAGAGDTGASPVVAEVDWFRVDPDRELPEVSADDEFDGDELDGCRWARTVRYDSNHVEVADGELKVTTQPGDIDNNNPLSPRNFILQDAPDGDWVATTRLKATMTHRWQYAGLLVYGDDDNYVKADIVADNEFGSSTNIKAELVSEVNAGFGAGGNRVVEIPETSESGWWYLRVTRSGSSYAAEVSDGGINWTPIGAPVTHEGDLSAVGLVAVGPEQVDPVTIGFDYFHLDAEAEEDTTAPTTELSLEPATPDGANGWYTSAPTFTLSADDGDGSGVASTEWRIGEGDWTAYDEPVLLDDGSHEIAYRSTDEAGNVEEAGTTTVQVDTAAPETSAEVVDEESQSVVTLTAVDATSGVASTEVAVGDGDWAAYDEPVVVTGAGTHVVSFRSTDEAGLVEETQSVEVEVGSGEGDTTGPVVQISGLRHGAVYGHAARRPLRWTVTPTGSPVATVSAMLDGDPVQQGRLDLSGLSLGAHRLVVTAVDEAGNSTTETIRFRVRTSFKDVRKLVKRFAKDGSMTKAVRKDLVRGLKRAQRLSKRDSSAAVAELRKVRRTAKQITKAPHRRTIRKDVKVLIRGLR